MSACEASTAFFRSPRFSGWMGSAGWLGKVPSSSAKRISSSKGRPSKTLGTTRPPMPLAVSATTLQPAQGRGVDERADVVGVLVEQLALLVAAGLRPGVGARGAAPPRPSSRISASPVSWPDGPGPGQAHLDPVVAGRVVRGREHRPGGVEPARGEVHHVGGGQPEVDDRGPGTAGPGGEGRRELHARLPHVAGHQDADACPRSGRRPSRWHDSYGRRAGRAPSRARRRP